jgi:steroid delta-isomerase-like uncharacterized protein
MTRDELLAQIEGAYAAWNSHDAGAVAGFYTSDATVRDSADPDNPAVGSEAIKARAAAILNAFPDAKLEMRSISVDGDRVTHEWAFTGTHDGEFLGVPATGRPTRNIGASVERMNDEGLTTEETAYWDAAIFLRQVGALPEPTEAGTA